MFPDVLYVGLADGAKDNWTFLKPYTKRLLFDFYHAREYIGKAALAIFGRDKVDKKTWKVAFSRNLKLKQGTAARLIKALKIRSIGPCSCTLLFSPTIANSVLLNMTFSVNYYRFLVTGVHFSTARQVGQFCSAGYTTLLLWRLQDSYLAPVSSSEPLS